MTIEFDFSEEQFEEKVVYTIYGEKSSGKTTSFMTIGKDDKMMILSFDHKTITIKQTMFPNNKFKVYDAVRYYEKKPNTQTKTANISYEYIIKILEMYINSDNKPDYVVIDGLEVLNVICEMAMRYERGYKPYQGVSNMNDWKYRNDMLNEIHNLSMKCANKGVVYTTYSKMEEVIVDGAVIQRKEIPKWFGNVLMETDIVLKTLTGMDSNGQPMYKVYVESSKRPDILEDKKTYKVDIEKGLIKE